ncbi:MAG: DUF4339 domain-containing protein [Verrucomicrobiota bacterium]
MKSDTAQYFYTTASGRGGPVVLAELRALAVAGKIVRRDKVWCEGMAQWEVAGALSGLFDGLPPDMAAGAWQNPAPMQNSLIQCRQCGHEISVQAKACVRCGVPSPASGDYIHTNPGGFWFGKLVVIVGAGLLIWWLFHSWGDMNTGSRATLIKTLLIGGGACLVFLAWNGRGENPLEKKPEQETSNEPGTNQK